MPRFVLPVLLLWGCWASSAAWAQEMIDNPAYQDWSRFKVGTTVTYDQTMKAQGQDMQTTQTFELIELDKDKAKLQLKQWMNAMGMNLAMPAMTLLHPAKIKKEEEGRADQPGEMPRFKVEGGKEKIEAAGRTFDCTWGEVEVQQDGAKMKGKTWVSQEVPGGMVKMQLKGEVDGEPIEMHSQLSQFKIEK